MDATREFLSQPLDLRHMHLPNRLVRSATYEGMADNNGTPTETLRLLYRNLLEGGIGTLITGFMYVSSEGRAMQPRQCAMDSVDRVAPWKSLLASIRPSNPDAKIIAQIAHTGRQTRSSVTGESLVGAGNRACTFFRERPRELTSDEAAERTEQIGRAAAFAREAGFDAVQIHAAHGYLIHQFLSPWTNRRNDEWGDPNCFFLSVIQSVRRHAGEDFPVWVKLSWSEDREPGIDLAATAETLRLLDAINVDAAEISYGTMEWPMNIFRGDCPLNVAARVNPLISCYPGWIRSLYLVTAGRLHLRRLRPFSENYNADAAAELQRQVQMPVIPVGGIRSLKGIAHCLNDLHLPAVSLCRPLIHDPHFPRRLLSGEAEHSDCTNCNLCAVFCDSQNLLRCYKQSSQIGQGGIPQ